MQKFLEAKTPLKQIPLNSFIKEIEMKLYVLSILFLFSITVQAEVHCSATLDELCPPSAECIKVESILGSVEQIKPADEQSVE